MTMLHGHMQAPKKLSQVPKAKQSFKNLKKTFGACARAHTFLNLNDTFRPERHERN